MPPSRTPSTEGLVDLVGFEVGLDLAPSPSRAAIAIPG